MEFAFSAHSSGMFEAVRSTANNLTIGTAFQAASGATGQTPADIVIYDRPLDESQIIDLYHLTKELISP